MHSTLLNLLHRGMWNVKVSYEHLALCLLRICLQLRFISQDLAQSKQYYETCGFFLNHFKTFFKIISVQFTPIALNLPKLIYIHRFVQISLGCPNLSKLDQAFSNWSQLVQSYLHLFKLVWLYVDKFLPFLATYSSLLKFSTSHINVNKKSTFLNYLTVWDRVPKEDAANFESDTFLWFAYVINISKIETFLGRFWIFG